MFRTFFPDEYLDSTYEIDFEKLYQDGYRGLIFDIDNTLVRHGEPADERAVALFKRLKKIGFDCCLLSNNQYERVSSFNKEVQVHFIEDAHKPSTKNYIKAMELMKTDRFQYDFCWRPVVHRCIWGKKNRNSQHFGKTNSSKRRDSDCVLNAN